MQSIPTSLKLEPSRDQFNWRPI